MPVDITAYTSVIANGQTTDATKIDGALNTINAAVWLAVVSSLPGTPIDGQECFYLADAGNSIVWHLKYRTSNSKWHKVGGQPLKALVQPTDTIGSASGNYQNHTTAGPSITVPLAGTYEARWGAELWTSGTGTIRAGLSVNGATPSDTDAMRSSSAGSTIHADCSIPKTITPAASQVVLVQYKANAASDMSAAQRWLTVDPVFVS